MDQVFVVKKGSTHLQSSNVAVTTLATIGDLVPGAIAVIGYYPTKIVPVTLATAADGVPSRIEIYQGKVAGKPHKVSAAIFPNAFTYNYSLGQAGVPPVVLMGANGGAGAMAFTTPAAGVTYGIEVTDLRKDPRSTRAHTVWYTATSAAITDDNVCTYLVAKLNAYPAIAAILTAAVINGDDGISFTATSSDELFNIRPLEGLFGSTVTTDGTGDSTPLTLPIGSYEQVLEAERRGQMVEGATDGDVGNRNPIYKAPIFTESGVVYDCINLKVTHVVERNWGLPSDAPSTSDISIYFDHADADHFTAVMAYLVDMANVANSTYLDNYVGDTALAASIATLADTDTTLATSDTTITASVTALAARVTALEGA